VSRVAEISHRPWAFPALSGAFPALGEATLSQAGTNQSWTWFGAVWFGAVWFGWDLVWVGAAGRVREIRLGM